tara:strand:- start:20 stop:232 length:213 start_codon:yes stop_codon:yes gene_type:complete
MITDELERAAYMAGDTASAGLLARIDDLTEALGERVADEFTELEQITAERDMLLERVDELLAELADLSCR